MAGFKTAGFKISVAHGMEAGRLRISMWNGYRKRSDRDDKNGEVFVVGLFSPPVNRNIVV